MTTAQGVLETCVPQHASILASAARLVKPGGRLVYAACSLLPAENEAQVEAFLAAHPGFRVAPMRTLALGLTGSAHPDHLALMPARHDTDGFFAAVMEREGVGATEAQTAAWSRHVELSCLRPALWVHFGS